MRRATGVKDGQIYVITQFQSTLSMRRATDSAKRSPPNDTISIHALHEESDVGVSPYGHAGLISIHALHEESDACRGS